MRCDGEVIFRPHTKILLYSTRSAHNVDLVARRLQQDSSMGHDASRRCALWVSPEILIAAQELASLLDVDVDTFIESVVLALRDEEAIHGRLRRGASAAQDSVARRRVVPLKP